MRILLFVENKSQVEAALESDVFRAGECRIIALSPEAMYSLDYRSISYAVPEDYYSEVELMFVGLDNFPFVEELCHRLDTFLFSNSTFLRKYDLRPCMLHFYHLKVLLDALTIRIFSLTHLFQKESPEEIYFFPIPPQPIGWELFSPNESFFTPLIPSIAAHFGVQATSLDTSLQYQKIQSTKPFWKQKLYELVGREKLVSLNSLLSGGLAPLIKSLLAPPDETILVIQDNRDIRSLITHCVRENLFRFVLWSGSTQPIMLVPPSVKNMRFQADSEILTLFQKEVEYLWPRLVTESWLKSYFVLCGIDCWNILKPRLEYFFLHSLSEILSTYLTALKVFDALNPRIVLTTPPWGYVSNAIIVAARHQGIPVVMYQHGGNYGYCRMPMDYYTDFYFSDYFFAYGDGIEPFVKKEYPHSKTQVVVVGSPALDALAFRRGENVKATLRKRYGLSPEKKTIMYVATGLGGNYRYISSSYSDIIYYRLQKQLVDLMSKFSDYQFIVKPQFSKWIYNPIADYIADKGVENIRIINQPFTKVMQLADAYIFDWPATAILEALTTSKAIVLFTDKRSVTFNQEAIKLLRKRTYFVDEVEAFLQLLEDLFSHDTFYKSVEVNDEFLASYGIPSKNGSSISRAVQQLQQIISNDVLHK